MSEQPLPEPLESFLQGPPSLPPSAELREGLWRRTTALLPQPGRRRWRTIVGIAAGIVLAILSGYVALLQHGVEPPPQKNHVEGKKESSPQDKPPPKEPDKPQPPAVAKAVSPLDLEWTAFDAPDNREKVRLYFQAGDLYFDKHKDYESAVRCYHQALHFCEARDLEIDSSDNWLVMALKRDRRKEQ